MSVSFLSPARTVLLISDDALFVFAVSGRGVKMLEAVPWGVENFIENVATIISKDCKGRPVLIVNDMVEQHYRKEKIPRVSVMDKQNVVKRKLAVAFSNYPVRAALPLKEKVAKTDKSLGGHVYIFAAVPASDSFSKTMSAAQGSLATVAGFCLLPIESSDMIKKLSLKLAAKGEKKNKWTIFMGQHQGGGLRQVVVKDGELALTRMTPISDHDSDPEMWVKDVFQEFQATMSYLSRFGFDPSDGLRVILVSDSQSGDAVSEMIDTQCDFHALDVQEISKLLKLPIGPQGAAHFADVLHVAWVGKKSKFILPMKAKQIDKVSKPRQVALLASVGLALGGAFFGYQTLDYYQKVIETKDEIDTLINRKGQLQLQYHKEVKRKEDLGFDIKLIQSSLAVYESLEARKIELINLLYNIGFSLGRDMRIDHFELKRGRLNLAQKVVTAVTGGGSPLYVAKMQMTFPSTTNAEKGNKEVEDLRTRIQMRMPDHIVKVSKFLEDYEYSEAIVVETGDVSGADSSAQDYVAEITIEGPVQK